MRLIPANALAISVLPICLWVKRLCHHQVVAVKRGGVEGGVSTDLEAEIFMTKTAVRP